MVSLIFHWGNCPAQEGGGVGILRYIVTSAFLAFLGARNFIVSFSWVERFWQDFS